MKLDPGDVAAIERMARLIPEWCASRERFGKGPIVQWEKGKAYPQC